MTNRENNTITPAEATFAAVVGGSLLAVSISQGSSHVWHMGTTALEHLWLVGMVVGALLGSQIMLRLAILNWKSDQFAIAFVLLCLVLGAERFSFITTRDAVHGRAATTIRSENLSSPEYRQAMKQVENYQKQVDSLMNSYDSLPVTYATKKENVQKQINTTTAKLERAQKMANSVNVSVTGKTMHDGGVGMSKLIALLQSAIPIAINLGTIMLSGSRQKRSISPVRSSPGKKPQARPARKVA